MCRHNYTTLDLDDLAAIVRWEDEQKREEAKRQQRQTAKDAQLEKMRHDHELAEEKAERAREKAEHELVQAKLKRQLSEKTYELD